MKKYAFIILIMLSIAFTACEKDKEPSPDCTRTFIQNTTSGEVRVYFEVSSISPDLDFYVKLEIPKRGTVVQIAKASFKTNNEGMYYGLALHCFNPNDLVKAGVYSCGGAKPATETYQISFRPVAGNYSWAEESLAIGETFEFVVK